MANRVQAVKARLALRDREVEEVRGRLASAGALQSTEKAALEAELAGAASTCTLLQRQLAESQAKARPPPPAPLALLRPCAPSNLRLLNHPCWGGHVFCSAWLAHPHQQSSASEMIRQRAQILQCRL